MQVQSANKARWVDVKIYRSKDVPWEVTCRRMVDQQVPSVPAHTHTHTHTHTHNASLNTLRAPENGTASTNNCLQFMTRLRLSEDHAELSAS